MAVSVFSESEVSISFGVGVVSSGGGVGLLAAVSVFLESAVMWVFILAGMVGMEEGVKDFARC